MKQNWKVSVAIFLACQGLSIFGSSLVQFAITWHITLTTKSGVYATLAILCAFLPTLVLSPFAGVWADRYNRKILIILADGGIALCTLALAAAFSLGHGQTWMLLAAAAVRALGSAVQMPCVGAMLPDLVPQEQLTRVNGINSSLQSLIMLLSPMLGGALLSVSRIENIFFVDVVTALAAISVMLLFLQVPRRMGENSAPPTGADYLGELKAGFAYVAGHAFFRNFFLFCGVFMFMMAPVAFLTPLQTVRTFGEEVWRLTAVEIAFSVGMTLGGIFIAVWKGMENRVHTMAMGCYGMALSTLAMGFPHSFWLYLMHMGLCGMTVPLFNTPATVMLQEQADPAYIGRVFGVMSMLGSSLMPLGMLFFGPLADLVAVEWLLVATGAVMTGVASALLRSEPLLTAGSPLAPPPKDL